MSKSPRNPERKAPEADERAGQETRFVNYFFYKCGKANCWLPLANEGHGLYVGFSDKDAPTKSDPHPILSRKPSAQFEKLTGYDDDELVWLCHEENREWFVLVTFDKQEVVFWEVTGRVKAHGRGTPVFKRALELREQATGGPRKEYSFDDDDVFKTLPARKVARIGRSALYTSIDSLAVYQYFNRGTCRRMWRAGGPTGAAMSDAIKDHRQGEIRGAGGGERASETSFGAFTRLYLNGVLKAANQAGRGRLSRRHLSQPELADSVMGLKASDKQAIVLSTLNPILVETAAMYLCLDLGLVADIGIGKGIDVVDIRARAESSRIAEHAAAKLRNVLDCDAICDRLIEENVLELQCKASDQRSDYEHIVYFGYRAMQDRRAEESTIRVPDLGELIRSDEMKSGFLSRFIAMQVKVLLEPEAVSS